MPQYAHNDKLGSYVLVGEKALGSGAYGEVWEARKERVNKRVALKLLHANMVKDPDVVARFWGEAKAVADLRHPHIVEVHDLGEVDGTLFIEMELLRGETLKARLRHEEGERLPPTDALDLLLPVFSAVAYVHDRGIVHRDIKPDNVFLADRLPGVVCPKLLDFGIAKLRDSTRELTSTGAFMGSVPYMSLEQVNDSKEVDARSDQWSLAVVVYRCLTGRLPFEATTLPAMVGAIQSGVFPRPRELNPDIPQDVEAALLRAMERDPSRRHPSVKAFGAALLPYAGTGVRITFARDLTESAAPPPPERPATRSDLPRASRDAPPTSMTAEPPVVELDPSSSSLKPREFPSDAHASRASPRRGATALLVAGRWPLAALAVMIVGLWLVSRRVGAPSSGVADALREPAHPPVERARGPVVETTATALADAPPERTQQPSPPPVHVPLQPASPPSAPSVAAPSRARDRVAVRPARPGRVSARAVVGELAAPPTAPSETAAPSTPPVAIVARPEPPVAPVSPPAATGGGRLRRPE